MYDRSESGKSTILTVIGITVILLGIILIASPVILPSLATGANPPLIIYCSILYQAQYATTITAVPVSCQVVPASGSGIQSVVFRYAQTTMTPSEALDPTNNYANARTLQWTNITLTPQGSTAPVTYSASDGGVISVDQGFYYYYVFNAYAYDGSSNYYPLQAGSAIVNNWFEVGNPTSTPTPTPTPTASMATVTFISGEGGSVQWTDSTAGTSSTVSGTSSSLFAINDALSVTAVPDSGYQFNSFYIQGFESGSTATNPFQTGVASSFTITANFVPSTSTTPTPTPNQNSSPTPTPNSPTPTPIRNNPTASPPPYNPFVSPTPAPYTTVTSWVLVAVGAVIALSGCLLVAVGQTGSSRKNSRR